VFSAIAELRVTVGSIILGNVQNDAFVSMGGGFNALKMLPDFVSTTKGI